MDRSVHTTCCIAGGGPAGLMLGYLLARAGVAVTVLEKHADFLRDFRGDTIHPSTMEIMHDLGLLEEFLTLPHQKVPDLTARFSDESLRIVDFSHLHVAAPYVAMMPQWDFLNFLARHAGAYPNFRLLMQTEATGLLIEGEGVAGVTATWAPDHPRATDDRRRWARVGIAGYLGPCGHRFWCADGCLVVSPVASGG